MAHAAASASFSFRGLVNPSLRLEGHVTTCPEWGEVQPLGGTSRPLPAEVSDVLLERQVFHLLRCLVKRVVCLHIQHVLHCHGSCLVLLQVQRLQVYLMCLAVVLRLLDNRLLQDLFYQQVHAEEVTPVDRVVVCWVEEGEAHSRRKLEVMRSVRKRPHLKASLKEAPPDRVLVGWVNRGQTHTVRSLGERLITKRLQLVSEQHCSFHAWGLFLVTSYC
eukprot:gene17472-23776_t